MAQPSASLLSNHGMTNHDLTSPLSAQAKIYHRSISNLITSHQLLSLFKVHGKAITRPRETTCQARWLFFYSGIRIEFGALSASSAHCRLRVQTRSAAQQLSAHALGVQVLYMHRAPLIPPVIRFSALLTAKSRPSSAHVKMQMLHRSSIGC